MARLLHHMSHLVAPDIISLLLAALAPGPAATAAETPVKKVRMRIRHANTEEAQWLDRYEETHEPLGAGPLTMVRATPEEEHWLNRLSDVGESHDGEDGGYIEFDDDNPYVQALRDWVFRSTKQSVETSAQLENAFQTIFRDAWRPSISSEWHVENASEEIE